MAPAAPEWQNNFFDKGADLLRALHNDSDNYPRLFEMRGWRLRPAPPNFKHGAGHLARPDTASEPKKTFLCTLYIESKLRPSGSSGQRLNYGPPS